MEEESKSYIDNTHDILNMSNTQNFGIIKGLPQILPLFYFIFHFSLYLHVRLYYYVLSHKRIDESRSPMLLYDFVFLV